MSSVVGLSLDGVLADLGVDSVDADIPKVHLLVLPVQEASAHQLALVSEDVEVLAEDSVVAAGSGVIEEALVAAVVVASVVREAVMAVAAGAE
jgi:hypothetical protein